MTPESNLRSALRRLAHAGVAVSIAACLFDLTARAAALDHRSGAAPGGEGEGAARRTVELPAPAAGSEEERTIGTGETQVFRLALAAGQVLEAEVDQRGTDVRLAVIDPDGHRLEMDSPGTSFGLETISRIAPVAGDYRLEVEAAGTETASGAYSIRLETARAATRQDRQRAAVEELYSHGLALAHGGSAESLRASVDALQQALAGWRGLDDWRGQVATYACLGTAVTDLGEHWRAADYLDQALVLAHDHGDRHREVRLLSSLGQTYAELEEVQKAVDFNARAVDLAAKLEETTGRSELVYNSGIAYVMAGELDTALDTFQQALTLCRGEGPCRDEDMMLQAIGFVYLHSGNAPLGLDYYQQSLALTRGNGHRLQEASTLNTLGEAHLFSGDYDRALELFQESQQLTHALGYRRGEAYTLKNIGKVYVGQGDLAKGFGYLEQALPMVHEVGDRRGEAETLLVMARTDRARGRLDAAVAEIEAALEIVESQRSKIYQHGLRASYFGFKQSFYELHIALLMQLDRLRPGAGFDARAFWASEQAHARGLLEILAEAHADIRNGVDLALLTREQQAQRDLDAASSRRRRLLGGDHTEAEAAAAEREVDEALRVYRAVEAQVRLSSPRYAALTQPEPLDLEEIQRRVLDPETVLLEYSVGEEQSYVWAVTSSSLHGYELPPRREIEEAARRVYQLLTARRARAGAADDTELYQAAEALSAMALGPVAGELGGKRLLVVAEGALQYIPFAALSEQGAALGRGGVAAPYEPLMLRHEIVSLPSASVLEELRREVAGRQPAPKALLVVADPVFDKEDPRVALSLSSLARPAASPEDEPPPLLRGPLVPAEGGDRPMTFPRLRSSRAEATTILSLVPPGQAREMLDFDAARDQVLSPELGRYRIVHFATHGLLNSKSPELSGLVLSLVDRRGEPQDGFLRLHDIYNLGLDADLVVLSACQTALGQDIRGEGLVGLTRGFMYAGAARVLASLWSVDDLGTSELMRRFYAGMLHQGLTPVAALRAAQLSMWRDERHPALRSPYYWAGFVLQGDWR